MTLYFYTCRFDQVYHRHVALFYYYVFVFSRAISIVLYNTIRHMISDKFACLHKTGVFWKRALSFWSFGDHDRCISGKQKSKIRQRREFLSRLASSELAVSWLSVCVVRKAFSRQAELRRFLLRLLHCRFFGHSSARLPRRHCILGTFASFPWSFRVVVRSSFSVF